MALVVGVAPGSRNVQPLKGPGNETLIVLAFRELVLTGVAPERPMGMRTATTTRASAAPRPIDPRRTMSLLQTQVESQRGEGEDQRDGQRDAVQIALDHGREIGRASCRERV